MDAKRLIVIEDDARILDAITDLLAQHNYVVAGQARNLPDALQLVTNVFFDCAVVDMKLFGEDVASLILLLQSTRTPYVLISGTLPSDIETQWLRTLPQLLKPFGAAELLAAIDQATIEAVHSQG